ncbi:MAG: urease accessory protein UreD [Anaerolineales bacterium]|nr:urease accessory protein UreD [Anaerolineales bacterium]
MSVSPHCTDGRLNLHFYLSSTTGQTQLRVVAQTPPLRVVRGFNQPDGAAMAHLHNVSGGVLGGDALTVTAAVGPGARAQLTTPGATRVYRHRSGRPDAVQINDFTVEAGGLLEYLPDPLIPFAAARYRQATRIELADDAGLFWWEIVAPGRETRDELFAYEQLDMTVDITAGGRPIAIERLRLEPGTRPVTSTVRLGAYRYFSTFYICRAGQPASVWSELEQELAALTSSARLGQATAWAVSALPRDGLVIRGLGCTGRALQTTLIELWQAAKNRLYKAAAILPRKLY